MTRRTDADPCVTVVTRRPVESPSAGCIDLHLDDVSRHDHRGSGRSSGEDHIAGLESEVLREVGDQLGEGEDEAGGRVVLRDLAVDPRAHAQGARVDLMSVEQGRTDRREPVAALRADVGALVVRAKVVEAEVVGGRHVRDMTPRLRDSDSPGRVSDHQGDLALEREQFCARRTFDRVAGCRHRARRLEEVRRVSRAAAALVGAGRVAQVDRDDLARPHGEQAESAGCGIRRSGHELPRPCVVFEIVYYLRTPGKHSSEQLPDSAVE